MAKDKIILVNLSGRGDKDLGTVFSVLNEKKE
jgi:tryptophan synthase beta subunit